MRLSHALTLTRPGNAVLDAQWVIGLFARENLLWQVVDLHPAYMYDQPIVAVDI